MLSLSEYYVHRSRRKQKRRGFRAPAFMVWIKRVLAFVTRLVR
jgi:hypothetical protein